MAVPVLEDQMQMERSARAEAALNKGEMIVSQMGDDKWLVISKTSRYTVTLENDAWACTCPDFAGRCQLHGLRCKHIEAVRLISKQSNQRCFQQINSTEDHMTGQALPTPPPAPDVVRQALQEALSSPDEIIWRLRQPLDMSRVKRRQAPGQGTVPYLEGYDVIEAANELFQFRWSFELMDEPHVMRWEKVVTFYDQHSRKKVPVLGDDGKPTTDPVGMVFITGKVMVEIGGKPYSHADVGRCVFCGDTPEALDMALAGAATDCLKRCFRQLGEQFGLSLYDKEVAKTAGTGNGSGAPARPGTGPLPPPPAPAAALAGQNGAVKYGDGSLVDAANAAELSAFNAYKKANPTPPQTREALRVWVQANQSGANGNNGNGKH